MLLNTHDICRSVARSMLSISLASCVLLCSQSDALADTSYLAHYPLDPAAGWIVPDSSGNGYDGERLNVSTGMPPAWKARGLVDGALEFVDDGAAVKLPHLLLDGARALTVALWFKTTDQGESALLSGANPTTDNECTLFLQNPTTLVLYLKGTATVFIVPPVNDNEWHHLRWTRNTTGTNTLYLDSTRIGERALPAGPLVIAADGLWLGQEQDAVGGGWQLAQGFHGLLDQVQVARDVVPPLLTHGPVLGGLSATSVNVWIRTPVALPWRVYYRPVIEDGEWAASALTTTRAEDDQTGVVTLSGLDPSTVYEYVVEVSELLQEDARGRFATLPHPDRFVPMTFAFGADVHQNAQPHTLFHRLSQHRPMFMLLLGDAVYVGRVDDTAAHERIYRDNWDDYFLRRFLKNHPTYFTWDDHEIEDNWSGGMGGRYINARRAFDEYASRLNPPALRPGALFYSFAAGDTADFFMLDTRSHRSANSAPDNAGKSMLGAEQKRALKDWLLNATAPFKFIVSSVFWNDFGTTGSDSWAGFTTERSEIEAFVTTHHIPGVLILSGDQHWVLIGRLTTNTPHYHLYEWSPTPLSAPLRAAPALTDSQVLYMYDQEPTFGLVTVNPQTSPSPTVTLRVINASGTELYALTISQDNVMDPATAYFPLDTILEGLEVPDTSGNGYTGERRNIADGPPPRWVLGGGLKGGALEFVDPGAAVQLPHLLVHGATAVTFETWLQTTDGGESAIISGANAAVSNEYTLFIQDATTLAAYVKGAVARFTMPALADGQWHHVRWVRQADGLVRLYVDGALIGQRALPVGPLRIDPNGLWLGQEQDAVGGGWQPSQAFDGLLDEMYLWRH